MNLINRVSLTVAKARYLDNVRLVLATSHVELHYCCVGLSDRFLLGQVRVNRLGAH
jgi:hypothetical protein